MIGSGNFIARWSRLKRENDAYHEGDGQAATVRPSTDADVEEAFDPSSLPSIDAITAATDVRGFLQRRVPLELTRAALRQAWASDPSIRDFIGIAENQWDFNDPNAIFGFGSLEAADKPGVLAHAIDKFEKLSEMPSRSLISEAPSRSPDVELASADANAGRSANKPRATDAGAERPAPREEHDCIRNQRRHGSAVPR